MKCISLAKVFHFLRSTKESFLKDGKGFEKSYSSSGVAESCLGACGSDAEDNCRNGETGICENG